MSVPVPPDEAERISALQRYRLLDTEPEPALDRFTELASHIFKAPIALLSLVAWNRNLFKSRHGWSIPEISREESFCAFTILSDDVLVITNAREDARFAQTSLVRQEPRVCYYAGAPLKTPGGFRIGTICICDWNPRPVLSAEQKNLLQFLAAAVMELLEFRRAALEAAESALFAAACRAAAVGIAVLDEEGRFLASNQACQELFGVGADELAQQTFASLLPPNQRARLERVPPAGVWEAGITRKDGAVLDVHVTSGAMTAADGRQLPVITLTDVTRLKRVEERLRRSQKMEAVVRLAGGIAHGANNLLTIITGYSQLLIQQLPAGQEAHRYAEEVFRAAQRTAALTQHLLAFSRHRFVEPRPLDLNALLVDFARTLRRIAGKSVELALIPGPDLRKVSADAAEIEQVLRNLAINAREAMPSGGRITIETANLDIETDYPPEHPDTPAGRWVTISVTDTGHGMDTETRSHLFEPFFTTKGIGKGTGLPSVYGIVKQGGGEVAILSEPGKGTTVRIYLPAIERKDDPPLQIVHRGAESILVVDDDAAARGALCQILSRQGYSILEANGPEEALQLCETYSGRIDLVIADISAPQASRAELAEQLVTLRPGLKVLDISGRGDEGGGRRSRAGFLKKPFAIEDLHRRLRDLLDAPA